jgi:hypothetical protein
MIIKEITALALKDFINSQEYKKLPLVPITRHRALSHIKNPRVSPQDVILLLAYEGDHLSGYLGVLADKMIINNTAHKCGWLSCIWVDEGTKGKGVAKSLLIQAFRLWGDKIFLTQISPKARGTYIRSGLFMDPVPYWGIRGYLRFNLNELLAPKNQYYKKYQAGLKIIDGILNIFNGIRLSFNSYTKKNKTRIEYINEIDQETDLFIESKQGSNPVRKQAMDLDWIIKNPWVLTAPDNDVTSSRYLFSSLDKRYCLINIKVYDGEDKIKAFIMMCVKGGNLKIPYCYFNESDVKEVSDIIFTHMLKMNLHMVTIFHPLLRDHLLNHSTPFIYKKKIKQEYFISKIFETSEKASSFEFQDGDGDCAFT